MKQTKQKIEGIEREPVQEEVKVPERQPNIIVELQKREAEVKELREENISLKKQVKELRANGQKYWETLFQPRIEIVLAEKAGLQKKLSEAQYVLGIIRAAVRGR